MDRLRDLWGGFYDAFVRENRVLPPVVALLALFLFAWVVAGAFVNESGDETMSGEADLVQSREPSGDTPIAPEAEDRDADSYAAYRNKDPFRQLFAPAEAAPEETPQENTADETTADETTSGETTAPNGTTTGNGGGNTGGGGTGGNGAGQRSRTDSDGDGLTNRQEQRLGQDPRDPDTDGDGTEDGADDSDNDGIPDGRRNNAGGAGGTGGNAGGSGTGTGGDDGASGGTGTGGGGGAGGGGANGSDDELFDSGGGNYPR